MIEALLQAVANFGHPQLWAFLTGGVVTGLIFGVIPGISGMTAIALFLPFVFALTAEQALPFMIGVLSASLSGGLITAVLLGVPGTPGNSATLLDGYAMSKKGEAGRALGGGVISSLVGTIITVLFALVLVQVILPLAMAIYHADMVVVILIGITCIGTLSGGSMTKGILSGLIGLAISLIGYQAVTGTPRFTLDIIYLYDGLPVVPVTLGLFAIPEMVSLATRGGSISRARVEIGGMRQVWQGAWEVLQHRALVLRSTVVGFVGGLIPGVGPSITCFMGYAQAKKSSPNPERFGTGIIEGVIAPETANNACEAGSLLTTLAVGIPGSPAMAIVLAAFLMLGIIPGPRMMTERLDISLTLLFSLGIGCVIASVIVMWLAARLAWVATVPASLLAPAILGIVFVGTFAYREKVEDIFVLIVIGALAVALRRYGYNMPALFLGFLLGTLFEEYLFLALGASGPLFFVRPIALSLIALMIVYFSFGPVVRLIRRRKGLERS